MIFLDKLTLSEMQAVASARGTYYVMSMTKQDQDIISKALSAAKQAGADGADVSFIKGGGQMFRFGLES